MESASAMACHPLSFILLANLSPLNHQIGAIIIIIVIVITRAAVISYVLSWARHCAMYSMCI